jgi:hypothetical protein
MYYPAVRVSVRVKIDPKNHPEGKAKAKKKEEMHYTRALYDFMGRP